MFKSVTYSLSIVAQAPLDYCSLPSYRKVSPKTLSLSLSVPPLSPTFLLCISEHLIDCLSGGERVSGVPQSRNSSCPCRVPYGVARGEGARYRSGQHKHSDEQWGWECRSTKTMNLVCLCDLANSFCLWTGKPEEKEGSCAQKWEVVFQGAEAGRLESVEEVRCERRAFWLYRLPAPPDYYSGEDREGKSVSEYSDPPLCLSVSVPTCSPQSGRDRALYSSTNQIFYWVDSEQPLSSLPQGIGCITVPQAGSFLSSRHKMGHKRQWFHDPVSIAGTEAEVSL